MRRIRIPLGTAASALLATACLFAAPATAAADEASWLYDPNTVVEINLGLSEAEIQELEAEPDEYVNGSFEAKVGDKVKGSVLPEVGIRLKGGAGSFQTLSEKPAFKIKFDKYVKGQRYFGLEKMTLNNMVQDASMIHEALAYELFRAMGIPAPRSGYAFTRLNGEVIGLHADIEGYDKVSLPKLFSSTQHLYEADTFDVDVVPGGATAFEVDEGDDEDLADLEALIEAANDEEGDWSDGMAAVADLEEMTRMWAVERYIGHWDGYAGGAIPAELRPNNYYLHSDAAGVFEMAPWGTDQTWDTHLGFAEEAGGLLFNKCYADTSCQSLYKSALGGLQDLVPSLEFPSKARRYAGLLEACQALEPESRRPYDDEEMAKELEETLDFIDERQIPLDEYLETESPQNGPETGHPPTEEPCGPDPEPEPEPEPETPPTGTTSQTPAQPGPAPQASNTSVGFGVTHARGARISTEVAVPGPGTATEGVRAWTGRKWKLACSGQKASAGAGSVTVTCSLPGWARQLRKSHRLRIKVRVGFEGLSGANSSVTRRLTLARLG